MKKAQHDQRAREVWFSEILEALGLPADGSDLNFDPSSYEELQAAEQRMQEPLGKEKADEIVGLAMVGELSIVRLGCP